MNEQFQALPVDRACARVAYPLVYLHDSSVTLDKWLRFAGWCRSSAANRRGLIAIRDRRGIVHALFSYRADVDMRLRKRLSVANLIVAHLPGSRIDSAVAACINGVAADLGCQTVNIEQPFHQHISSVGACPTARLLRDWPGGRGRVRH